VELGPATDADATAFDAGVEVATALDRCGRESGDSLNVQESASLWGSIEGCRCGRRCGKDDRRGTRS
jgi:hypothetical protein